MGSVHRVGAVLALVFAAVLGTTPAASAHATLLFTTPAVDGAVPTSPEAIQLVFDQPVVASGSAMRLTDAREGQWKLDDVRSGSNGQTLTAKVASVLPVGEYTVHWQAVASDGDTMLGDYRFAVGTTAGLSLETGAVATRGLVATAALRWILFVGLALSLGGLLGDVLTKRAEPAGGAAPGPWARTGAALGLVASLGLGILVLGRGSIVAGIGSMSVDTLVSSLPGRVAIVETGTFAAALGLLSAHRRTWAMLLL